MIATDKVRLFTLIVLLLSPWTSTTAFAAPDLVVSHIEVDPDVLTSGMGGVIGTIANIGGDDVSMLDVIYVEMWRDGSLCDDGMILMGLSAGDSASEASSACAPDAPGEHEITFVVDAANQITEENEDNNILTATLAFGPDLTITNLELDASEQQYGTGVIQATITNQGATDTSVISSFAVDFIRNGIPCDSDSIFFGIEAGDSHVVESTACDPSNPGAHEIKVVADAQSEIAEIVESNNEYEGSLEWPWPDLMITDIVLDSEPAAVGSGEVVATVLNQGSAATPGATNIEVRMMLDGEICDDGMIMADLFFLDALNVSEEAQESSWDCNPDSSGWHVVTFIVDPEDKIFELDETNNTLEVELAWHWPDLKVKSLVFDGDQLQTDASNSFIAIVENVGLVPTGSLTNIGLNYYLDGTFCDDDTIFLGLDPGESVERETDACNPTTPGSHSLEVRLDEDGDVSEEDEENNALEKAFFFCGVDEFCNGVDDDCDASTDESFPDLGTPCDGEDTDQCLGGLYICDATGTDIQCSEPPGGGELCDGMDNDCDEAIDEDWSELGTACEGESGPCEKGSWSCRNDGIGVICKGEIVQESEICDGVDNDCDDAVDENWPELGSNCEFTAFGCTKTGLTVCSDEMDGTTCAIDQSTNPELCNGLDDDCDGAVDEDFPLLGTLCLAADNGCDGLGSYACDESLVSVVCLIDQDHDDSEESCGNQLDDNCDGLTDEGCPCGSDEFLLCGSEVGLCERGIQSCDALGLLEALCNGGVSPSDELCDEADNDCDGTIDEGCSCDGNESRTCGSDGDPCSIGEQTCVDGHWSHCDWQDGLSDEQCNGLDDDCDGLVDDGCACTPGDVVACPSPLDDACEPLARKCQADGTWTYCGPSDEQVPDGCDEADIVVEEQGASDVEAEVDIGPLTEEEDELSSSSTTSARQGSDSTSNDATEEPPPARKSGGCATGPLSPTSSLIYFLLAFIPWIPSRRRPGSLPSLKPGQAQSPFHEALAEKPIAPREQSR